MFYDDYPADNPAIEVLDNPDTFDNPDALDNPEAWDNPDGWEENPDAFDNPGGRNPAILGIDAGDALAAAGGIWGAQNIAGLLGRWAPQGGVIVDRIRPGLGVAVYQLIGAAISGYLIGMAQPQWKQPAMLGGGALAVSNVVNAFAGQIDLIGGMPSFDHLGGQLGGGGKDKEEPKKMMTGGAGSLAPQQAASGLS